MDVPGKKKNTFSTLSTLYIMREGQNAAAVHKTFALYMVITLSPKGLLKSGFASLKTESGT